MGVVIFLFSIVMPFMEYVYAPLMQIPERRSVFKVELWSFKCSVETFGWRHNKFDLWFLNFWLRLPEVFIIYADFSNVSIICAVLFATQTLTLSTALASIFIRKKLVVILPVIICLTTVALMTYAFIQLSQIPDIGWADYRAGYPLTYLSEALFATGATIKIKFDNKRIHHH
ncbi:MAG: hypothetical protein QW660_02885 [Candidatus Bathyarchaeia archaeon]